MTLTKAKFRQDCLLKLKSLPKHNKKYRDFLVHKKLLCELKNIRNKSILIYHPLANEVNLLKVIARIRKTNDIYIPFMEKQSFKIVKFRLPLRKKKFNIFEAGNSFKNKNTIDIAIVPVIGVDNNLQRVGFGKGMYDRFFAKLQNKPYTIFIQAEECSTKENVCDAHDISCNVLLTPRTIKRKR